MTETRVRKWRSRVGSCPPGFSSAFQDVRPAYKIRPVGSTGKQCALEKLYNRHAGSDLWHKLTACAAEVPAKSCKL
jgi:hypothetical protein